MYIGYSSYDSSVEFRTLDQHVRQEVSKYMRENGFMPAGHLASGKQMRVLGVPSMGCILQRKFSQADSERDMRAKVAQNEGSLRRQVHWNHGCIAVTNLEVEEIWPLVPLGAPAEIRP